MASGKGGKISVFRVAVCGLTSSSFNGMQGQGAGKSCLCNRFMQGSHDKFTKDHTSVVNLSEYGSNVINNTHFLYWGEKVAMLEDGQDIKFQVSCNGGLGDQLQYPSMVGVERREGVCEIWG